MKGRLLSASCYCTQPPNRSLAPTRLLAPRSVLLSVTRVNDNTLELKYSIMVAPTICCKVSRRPRRAAQAETRPNWLQLQPELPLHCLSCTGKETLIYI
jgi:hypothetical protein